MSEILNNIAKFIFGLKYYSTQNNNLYQNKKARTDQDRVQELVNNLVLLLL
nr:MAG TPA: hypothetical protein [Caudoviricetes sp.]